MVEKFNHSIDKYFINYKFNQASNLIWIRRFFIFCKYGKYLMKLIFFGIISKILNKIGATMSNLKNSVDFIKEIEKLKSVTRFNRTLDGRFENSAEHSWQCAIAAMVLKDFYPEKLNIEKTMSILPEEKYLNMKNLWLEFEKGQSAEARYARVIDALVPLINHLEVSELNYNPNNISADMVLEKKKFIKSESEELWKLTEDLIQESVERGLYL